MKKVFKEVFPIILFASSVFFVLPAILMLGRVGFW